MSGIFGLFNRNGNHIEKNIAEDMLETMSGWEPDESNLWIDGSIALGHAMLWNTPESKYEHLPLQKDTYILTMDARIDNREALAKELDLPGRPMEEIGDSEFILASYRKWGEECPKYLLGDFTFVIWDNEKEHLFCARDHIGIKLFHFYFSDDLFIFSNDIEGVLAHPKVSHIFNDNTVSDFFKDEGIHTKSETLFKEIHKLPPATSLTITSSSIKKNEYWCIENSPLIHYNSYDEYVDKLKELLDISVEARLRTFFPVASHLSGGIDSSPLAVLAARKLEKKNKKLHVFNWINIPKGDEYEFEAWNFSRRISENENIDHKEFSVSPNFIAKQLENHNIFTKGTMYSWEEYMVQDMVENIGARTLLSGWGGDELISYSGYSYILGLFYQGKIIKVIKFLLAEKKFFNNSWSKFIKYAMSTLFPLNIIKYIKKRIRKHKVKYPYYETYMNEKFIKFMESHHSIEFPDALGVRKNQLSWYNFGHLQHRIESWAQSVFSKKIEYCYPLLDKRIVEFAIGIPEDIFYPKNGRGRPLIKKAVKDLLPDEVVWSSKPVETKINEMRKQNYIEVLEIMRRKYQKYDYYNNEYIENKKFKEIFDKVDLKKLDTYALNNIGSAVLFLNSMKNYKINV